MILYFVGCRTITGCERWRKTCSKSFHGLELKFGRESLGFKSHGRSLRRYRDTGLDRSTDQWIVGHTRGQRHAWQCPPVPRHHLRANAAGELDARRLATCISSFAE